MKTQRLTAGLLSIAAVLAIWALAAPPGSSAANHAVSIVNFSFSPVTTTINVGDTVVWTNDDQATHTTTSSGNWDSGDLKTSDVFSRTFSLAGTFAYFCARHSFMQGTVVVVAASATPTNTATATATSATPGATTSAPTSVATPQHPAYIPVVRRAPPAETASPTIVLIGP